MNTVAAKSFAAPLQKIFKNYFRPITWSKHAQNFTKYTSGHKLFYLKKSRDSIIKLSLWNFFKHTWGRQDFWPFFSFVCGTVKIVFFGFKIVCSNFSSDFPDFRGNWTTWKKSFGQKIIFHFFGSKNEKKSSIYGTLSRNFPFFSKNKKN